MGTNLKHCKLPLEKNVGNLTNDDAKRISEEQNLPIFAGDFLGMHYNRQFLNTAAAWQKSAIKNHIDFFVNIRTMSEKVDTVFEN